MFHPSPTEWVILIALSFVWAMLGYRFSENDRRTLGRTPWGLPSAVWALIWFLSLALGLVLYLIAHSIGVRRAQQNPQGLVPPGSGPPPPMGRGGAPRRAPTVSEQFPAYPRPANLQVDGGESVPEPAMPPASPTSASAPQSPPAWQPDPSGRFHYRWWDGTQWTSQVSTDGHHLIDTNPDQRIGPY